MIQVDDNVNASPGFTMIELLIAMALASVLMVLIVSSFWAQSKIGRDQQIMVNMQQNLRSATYLLERGIMMAGYDGNPDDTISATIITANPTVFSFQYVDDATNNVATVTYDLYDALSDGVMDIGRSFNGNPQQAVAENIEALEFYYTLADGTQATTITPQNQMDMIRSVGISILARADSATGAVSNRTYTSLSGASWGPYHDGVRRQLVTATIDCRNMK